MKNNKDHHFLTDAVHGGEHMDPTTGAHNTPIYQSSTFVYRTLQDAKDARKPLPRGERRYGYSRVANPTVNALEDKLALLEEGEAALCTSWGMSATSTLVLSKIKDKRHVICSDTVYGGTHLLLNNLLISHGVRTSFIDLTDLNLLKDCLERNPDTALVFFESPTNPTMKVIDVQGVVDISHRHGAKVVFDNTFMTPYIMKPLTMGADFICSSLTKYISGHGHATGGVIIGKYEAMDEVKLWRTGMGTTLHPFDAWLMLNGVKTLAVRVEAQCKSAMEVARFLDTHPLVKKVLYPGLESHPQHELAKKQMKRFGAMLSFELDGDEEKIAEFLDGLELCALGVSLGDVSTLIEQPASMTHGKMTEEARREIGITRELIRLSVGLEDPADIIGDLKRSLDAVG